jgi:phage shock protein A
MNKLTISTDFTDTALPTDLPPSQQLNRELLALVAALKTKLEQLETQVAELKARLNDSSATASNPPSRDTK